MENIKNQAVTYNSNVTAEKLALLTHIINTGKNANVLLTIGKALMKGNELPKWALTMPATHFEQMFNLTEKSLSKVCSSDSYHDLRSMINLHLKGEVITLPMYENLIKIMSITKFQKLDILMKIKSEYQASLEAKALLNALALSFGCHKVEVEVKSQVVKTDLSELTNKLTSLELSEAILMMEVLQGRLNDLSKENAEIEQEKQAA